MTQHTGQFCNLQTGLIEVSVVCRLNGAAVKVFNLVNLVVTNE